MLKFCYELHAFIAASDPVLDFRVRRVTLLACTFILILAFINFLDCKIMNDGFGIICRDILIGGIVLELILSFSNGNRK